ncbi:MAG: hypothetical protein K6G91_10520, partial [Kiritimatiellae bacterium]|nr:hypothetical protein [Kiritimatiellia bacterium]
NLLADASGDNNNNYAGIVQKNRAMVVNSVAYMNKPDAVFAGSYGDVYAGGDSDRNNWQNYFVNSAWGTWITKTVRDATVDTPSAIDVDASAFRNYSAGNFVPKTKGVLNDAGTSWEGYIGNGGRSGLDMSGSARLCGRKLDVGCFESAGERFYITIR